MELRPSKWVKLSPERDERVQADVSRASIRARRAAFLSSISRSISPPRSSRPGTLTPQLVRDDAVMLQMGAFPQPQIPTDQLLTIPNDNSKATESDPTILNIKTATKPKIIPSPFKLTSIRDLPPSKNVDTISLHEILGNPLIKEAWIFNYCFDIDWLMQYFDSDVRDQVKVKIIHGSWKSDSPNKQSIDDACQRWGNVEAATAYLPDQFGTHHSKMFILFTHDDLAQVVIHTANMLAQDWTNLTQAAWMSHMLPLSKTNGSTVVGKIGSGSRFKHDLSAYLAAYGSKTKVVREQLALFDFTSVRGALIASVPSHMKDYPTTKNVKALWNQKFWGYPSLSRALSTLLPQQQMASPAHVACQVSSIATLPQTWLNQFFPVLCGSPAAGPAAQQWDPSRVSIIYPTPANVGSSLGGYASGGSIHTKAQSTAHLKQITSLRSTLCQWTKGSQEQNRAGRDEIAPHVKTFISFSAKPTKDRPVPEIRWALLTSANLSQQAWGTLREVGNGKQKEKEVVVQSYEIGVLVWAELFAEDFDTGEQEDNAEAELPMPVRKETVRMVPVFGKSLPSVGDFSDGEVQSLTEPDTVVGLRLPYDLPLTPYGSGDMPWSMHSTYEQPDRWGRRWPRDFQ